VVRIVNALCLVSINEVNTMSVPRSDAFVLFGATGDLAYKQIFPALLALSRRGKLNMPVIGIGRSDLTREQFIARAKESVEQHAQRLSDPDCASIPVDPSEAAPLANWPSNCITSAATIKMRRPISSYPLYWLTQNAPCFTCYSTRYVPSGD